MRASHGGSAFQDSGVERPMAIWLMRRSLAHEECGK